jgi:branched-subunit amino acid transport protein
MKPAGTLYLWTIIIGGMLVTYATRLSFILLIPQERVPDLIKRALRYVPPAVLATLILPDLLLSDGSLQLGLQNCRLFAGLLAAFVSWRTKNTWLTIGVGIVALWLLSSL